MNDRVRNKKSARPVTVVAFGEGTPTDMESYVVIAANPEPDPVKVGDTTTFRWNDIRILKDGALFETGWSQLGDGKMEGSERLITDDEARAILIERVPLIARLWGKARE